jgi:hypothetical protein
VELDSGLVLSRTQEGDRTDRAKLNCQEGWTQEKKGGGGGGKKEERRWKEGEAGKEYREGGRKVE